MPVLDEGQAQCVFILNIIFPCFGTFISCFLDKKGFNLNTLLLSWLQAALVSFCFIGWIWGILWALKCKEYNAGRGEKDIKQALIGKK